MRSTLTPSLTAGRSRKGLLIGGVIAAIVAISLFATCSTHNKLVKLDQDVEAQWAQVENTYQRRADLVPNLVATVKGAAEFEKETLIAVTEARARVGQVSRPTGVPGTAEQMSEFQQAQDQLGGALSRLLVVSEAYPQLTATAGFRDLQAQLEGTENRIAVERMRFNEVAREYNTARSRFPASLIASMFGKFDARPYFQAAPGSQRAPEVEF